MKANELELVKIKKNLTFCLKIGQKNRLDEITEKK